MTGADILLHRAVIAVTGPDAAAFLDSLLTVNVSAIPEAQNAYGGLLTPQGKVIADMIIWRAPDDCFLLDLAPAHAAEVLRRLQMYRLRAQVQIEDLTGQRQVGVTFAQTIPLNHGDLGGADPRRVVLQEARRLVVIPRGQDAWPGASETYERLRLQAGAPDLSRDAEPMETFALEALFEEFQGVDFHKGCFVGQENVSRMKRRATTRKKFCPIVFEGPALPYGLEVKAGEAVLGTVRAGMDGRAIAFLRLDRALEAIDKGEELRAGDRPVRLDPPGWLILPAPTGGP